MIENIGRKYGKKAVICDNCGDGFESEDWESARSEMKERGWKTKKEGNSFKHYCDDCKEG